MRIKIGDFEYSEVWDGTFYKKLSNYPHITDWEMRTLIEFISYERENGRDCIIECEDKQLLSTILTEIGIPDKYKSVCRPKLITECTACPKRKGCETKYVCHTTSPEYAVSIFKCGSLLSAVRARGKTAIELSQESRNAAKDPVDYFDYVMFSWGNCQAGDRLVMERKLKRFPNEQDLSIDLTPGIRFYFKYDELICHPGCVFDGVLPVKIKNEVILKDWLYAIVIPLEYQKMFDGIIPQVLRNRVLFIDNDCKDIWEWSEKVYSFIEGLQDDSLAF